MARLPPIPPENASLRRAPWKKTPVCPLVAPSGSQDRVPAERVDCAAVPPRLAHRATTSAFLVGQERPPAGVSPWVPPRRPPGPDDQRNARSGRGKHQDAA